MPFIKDLLLNLNNIDSFNIISNKVKKANFLTWTGLRHAIPSILKTIKYSTLKDIILILCREMKLLTKHQRNKKTIIL